MTGQRERDVEENVIQLSLSFPELAIEVVIPIVGIRPVEVGQVATEQAGHQTYSCEWSQVGCTFRIH